MPRYIPEKGDFIKDVLISLTSAYDSWIPAGQPHQISATIQSTLRLKPPALWRNSTG